MTKPNTQKKDTIRRDGVFFYSPKEVLIYLKIDISSATNIFAVNIL